MNSENLPAPLPETGAPKIKALWMDGARVVPLAYFEDVTVKADGTISATIRPAPGKATEVARALAVAGLIPGPSFPVLFPALGEAAMLGALRALGFRV